jgi:hypothetical protein
MAARSEIASREVGRRSQWGRNFSTSRIPESSPTFNGQINRTSYCTDSVEAVRLPFATQQAERRCRCGRILEIAVVATDHVTLVGVGVRDLCSANYGGVPLL